MEGRQPVSWSDGLQRLASAFGVLTSSISAIPSPEQRILRLLNGKALRAYQVAEESNLPLREVYSILGSLYERRAVSTHPSGYFWVGRIDLPLDRLFQDRSLASQSEALELTDPRAMSA